MSDIKINGNRNDKLRKLSIHIDENLRADSRSGIGYVDPKGNKSRLESNQNHVVFGRRGSGKTTLLNQIEERKDLIISRIDLEDFKEISFPNILLHILKEVIECIYKNISTKKSLRGLNFRAIYVKYFRLRKKIGK